MKNLRFVLLTFLFFCLHACTVSNSSDIENDTQTVHKRSTINVDIASIDAMGKLTRNYYLKHMAVSPDLVFDGIDLDELMSSIQQEKLNIDQMGVKPYLQDLVLQGEMQMDVSNMLIGSYDMIVRDENDNNGPYDLAIEFESIYKKSCFDDPYYCYVYTFIYNLFLDYQNAEIELRDGCGFKDFFASVVAGIGTGTTIGSAIGEAFAGETILGLAFSAAGGIVGGAVGIIVGVFTFNSDCDDCGPVTGLSIQSDDDCDLSRTIAATGAGSDAAGYKWTIIQNGTTVNLTTVSNLLGITQTSSVDPITVFVRTICEDNDDSGDPYTNTFDLNVLDTSNPLGQAGDISLSHNCPQDGNTGGSSYVGCNSSNEEHGFYFISSNQTSGNISYEYEISPNSYLVNENSTHSIVVFFTELGNYTLTVRAINICTNDITEKTMNLQINN